MKRRRKNRKQVRMVVGLSICLLLIMTVGYAAFSTSLTISTKGNIKEATAAMQLKHSVVTMGDGLYQDPNDNSRYVYRGGSPDNYIFFNNEEWRIVAVEADGSLKIIKDEGLGSMAWDEIGNRPSSENTYCQVGETYGCNAWMISDNYVNGNFSGTVVKNASINDYLNGDYYSGLSSESKRYIVNHVFHVGGLSAAETETLKTQEESEKLVIWKGNVGLINATDYFKASLNENCFSYYSDVTFRQCYIDNYLYSESETYWTINAVIHDSEGGVRNVLKINKEKYTDGWYAGRLYYIRPVLYLKSDIRLLGSGTKTDPYIIK